MSSTRMSFSYPQEMKDKLTELAKQDCRSLSSYIQLILQEHLDKKSVKEPKTVPKRIPSKRRAVRKGKRAGTA